MEETKNVLGMKIIPTSLGPIFLCSQLMGDGKYAHNYQFMHRQSVEKVFDSQESIQNYGATIATNLAISMAINPALRLSREDLEINLYEELTSYVPLVESWTAEEVVNVMADVVQSTKNLMEISKDAAEEFKDTPAGVMPVVFNEDGTFASIPSDKPAKNYNGHSMPIKVSPELKDFNDGAVTEENLLKLKNLLMNSSIAQGEDLHERNAIVESVNLNFLDIIHPLFISKKEKNTFNEICTTNSTHDVLAQHKKLDKLKTKSQKQIEEQYVLLRQCYQKQMEAHPNYEGDLEVILTKFAEASKLSVAVPIEDINIVPALLIKGNILRLIHTIYMFLNESMKGYDHLSIYGVHLPSIFIEPDSTINVNALLKKNPHLSEFDLLAIITILSITGPYSNPILPSYPVGDIGPLSTMSTLVVHYILIVFNYTVETYNLTELTPN